MKKQIKQKAAFNMTRKELLAVKIKEYEEDIKFSSFILVPSKKVHDSGYGIMSLVFVDINDIPICRTNSCSDVVHINGIGGINFNTRFMQNKDCSWSIDLLPKSQLFRIWDSNNEWNNLLCGHELSSIEVFSLAKTNKKEIK